jgi:integrase
VGTITERTRKDGSTAYLAQITIKRDGRILHRENQTFDSRKRAAGWLGRREDELSQPGAIEPVNDPPLLDAIDAYLATSRKAIGKTKAQVLDSWKAHSLAKRRCSTIASADLVKAAQGLLDGGRKPQTVMNYMSHLSTIFAIARPAWGYPLSHQAITDAMAVTKRLGVTSKSGERDRRPTLDELNRILTHFKRVRARRPATVPMVDVCLFAIFSTRRQEEITRITWADLDEAESRVMVRDMKHPGDKAGNDQWVELPAEALAVVLRQPRDGECIFPYTTDAISAAFTRACKFLGIKDLHFHDLRHEGVSRLFELGWGIPQVACVSGHHLSGTRTFGRWATSTLGGRGWTHELARAAGNPQPTRITRFSRVPVLRLDPLDCGPGTACQNFPILVASTRMREGRGHGTHPGVVIQRLKRKPVCAALWSPINRQL